MQGRKENTGQPEASVPLQGVIDEGTNKCNWDLIQSREKRGNLSGFPNPWLFPNLQFVRRLLLGWHIDGEESWVSAPLQLLCRSLHMGGKQITEM